MAVEFTYSGTTIYLQNPQLRNVHSTQKIHSTGRTAGGEFYRYSKGVDIQQFRLVFDHLRDEEKDALQGFFETTVTGPSTDFTYVDHEGTSWNARFLDDTLTFTEVDDEKKQETTFIPTSTSTTYYPTTVRELPVWSVAINMEVW